MTNTGAFTVASNTFSGNGTAPIGVAAAGSGITIAANNSFTGKSHVHVEGGIIASAQTWGNGALLVYYVADNVTINASQTLNIQPNTVVKFAPDRMLTFSGNLNAVGSVGNRIVFTDFRDDTAGGDSNMDVAATSPAPGGWRGIELNNFASATMEYCDVRYGSSSSGAQANLYKTGSEGAVNISNSTFTNGAYRGISLVNATATITISDSIIRNNLAYGMFISGSGTNPTITKSQISGSNVGIYIESRRIRWSAAAVATATTFSTAPPTASTTQQSEYHQCPVQPGGAGSPSTTGANKVSSLVNIDTGSYLGSPSPFNNTSIIAGTPQTVVGNVTYNGSVTWDGWRTPLLHK